MKKICEVKNSKGNWEYVLSSSMKLINEYCKKNSFPDWRMVGMESRRKLNEIRLTAKEID